MRKDLHMSPGKLAAQVGHCAEAYWVHILKQSTGTSNTGYYNFNGQLRRSEAEEYIRGAKVKIIC